MTAAGTDQPDWATLKNDVVNAAARWAGWHEADDDLDEPGRALLAALDAYTKAFRP